MDHLPPVVREGVRYMLYRHTYFSAALAHPDRLACTDIYSGVSVPTAMATKRRIVFGETFANKLQLPKYIAFVLGHEIVHFSSGHPQRMERYAKAGTLFDRVFDPKLANVCMDVLINGILIEDGIGAPPPEEICPIWTPQKVHKLNIEPSDVDLSMLWEDLYKKVLDANPPPPPPPPEGGGSGDEDGSGQGGVSTPGDGEGGGSGQGLAGDVRPDVDANGSGQANDPDPMSETESKALAAAISSAAKQAGKASLRLSRALDRWTEPQVDWQDMLSTFVVRSSGDTDVDWSRPKRRQWSSRGHYYPRDIGVTTPPFLVGVDTSGSVSVQELQTFFGELASIAVDVGCEKLVVVPCDASVDEVHEWTPDEGDAEDWVREVAEKLHGGGGTKFEPVFEAGEKYARDTNTEFAGCVFFTDGYPFGWPEPWHAPVIWVITTDVVAPWGITANVKPAAG